MPRLLVATALSCLVGWLATRQPAVVLSPEAQPSAAEARALADSPRGSDDPSLPRTRLRSSSDDALAEDVPMIGVLLAYESTDVPSAQPGLLREIYVRVGDRVQRGDVIARLDPRLAELDREMAQAAVDTSRAEREQAGVQQRQDRERAERLAELFRAGVASEQQLSDAEFQRASGEAHAAAVASQLREQEARLQRLRTLEAGFLIRAPFSGTVAARYLDPGSAVAAGGPVVRVVSDSAPCLRFAAPERLRPQLTPGTKVNASPRDQPGPMLTAEIERVAPEIDPASRMLIVEARSRLEPLGPRGTGGEQVATALRSLGAVFDVTLLEPARDPR